MTFHDFIFNIVHRGLEHFGKFYSSYRGYVVDNEDPDKLGRIRVTIPMITRETPHTKWIFPKGSFSGTNYGSQILPMVGDLVWIEFEHGNTEFPIWSHAHFSKGDMPEEFINHQVYGFKSPKGQLVIIDDRSEEVYIEVKDADGDMKKYLTEVIAFNHGKNGGLVNVIELTKELNTFKERFNKLLSHYEKHVHIDPVSGYTGPISTSTKGSDLTTLKPADIELTDQGYIEDEKVLH